MAHLINTLLRNALRLPDDIEYMSTLRQKNVDLFIAVLSGSHLLANAFAHADRFGNFGLRFEEIVAVGYEWQDFRTVVGE